jgi:hypothetical protein
VFDICSATSVGVAVSGEGLGAAVCVMTGVDTGVRLAGAVGALVDRAALQPDRKMKIRKRRQREKRIII